MENAQKDAYAKQLFDHHNSVMVFPVCPRSFSDTVSERHIAVPAGFFGLVIAHMG
jgi:hypothetical protein